MATYSKPSTLARAVKGVLFGTTRNLVDTFNWLVSCWDNVKVGNGLKLTGALEGKPTINLNLTGGDGIEIVDNGGGELQIRRDTSDDPGDSDSGSINVTCGDETAIGVTSISFSNSGNVKFEMATDGSGDAVISARAVYA